MAKIEGNVFQVERFFPMGSAADPGRDIRIGNYNALFLTHFEMSIDEAENLTRWLLVKLEESRPGLLQRCSDAAKNQAGMYVDAP